MMCGACLTPVRYVIVGHHTVAVDPDPDPAGTIACPTDRYRSLAYVQERSGPPKRGYTLHKRHTHGRGAA